MRSQNPSTSLGTQWKLASQDWNGNKKLTVGTLPIARMEVFTLDILVMFYVATDHRR
jgi:hypothetical protein